MLGQYKTFFIMLILSIFTLQFVFAKDVSLKKKVTTLGIAHWGCDLGTRYGNILEKDLSLEFDDRKMVWILNCLLKKIIKLKLQLR